MRHFFIFIYIMLTSWVAFGQQPTAVMPEEPDSVVADTTPIQIKILWSDSLKGERVNGVEKRFLVGNVELQQDSLFLFCDQAELSENEVNATGDILVQQNDTIFLFADSMHYDGNSQIGFLFDSVVVNRGDARLFSEEIEYDVIQRMAVYEVRSIIEREDVQIQSDRGQYYVESGDAYLKGDVNVIGEEFELKADTLLVNIKTRRITYLGPTKIWRDSAAIYCEDGYYDYNTKKALFKQSARYARGTQKAIADSILYEGQQKIVKLMGNARFYDGEQFAEADVIEYDNTNDVITLIGNALYARPDQEVVGDKIIYNQKTESFETEGATEVRNADNTLKAKRIYSLNDAGDVMAIGAVEVQNMQQQTSLFCDSLALYNNGDSIVTMSQRPYLYKVLEAGDTLFMAADTFQMVRKTPSDTLSNAHHLDSMQLDQIAVDSFMKDTLPNDSLTIGRDSLLLDSLPLNYVEAPVRLVDEKKQSSDTVTYLRGYRNVAFYNEQFSGLADSMSYNTMDSTFKFMRNPIVWSDSSQFKADSMVVRMNTNDVDSINLYGHSIIINTEDANYFRQISGNQIFTKMKDGNPLHMLVDGNAQTVYFAQEEDDSYIAGSKTVCSSMYLYFKERSVSRIKCMDQTDGQVTPMTQIQDDTFKLPDFEWLIEKKPRSLESILQ